MQAGNPAFGAGFQRGDIAIREMQPHHAVEEFGGFGGGEAQIGGAQLGHLPPGAVAGQRQRRILTRGDDQVHLRRLAFEQKDESVVDRFGINQVIVVKNENKILRDGGNFVDQGRQERLGGRRLGGLQRSQHTRSDTGRDGLQSRNEVGQKASGVAIPCVQRKPRGGQGRSHPALARQPLADQRGLAAAGGGRDEDQLAMQPLVEPLDQARAEDGAWPRRGDMELGGQNGHGHRAIIRHILTTNQPQEAGLRNGMPCSHIIAG